MKQWKTAGVLLLSLLGSSFVCAASQEAVSQKETKQANKWVQSLYAGAGLQNTFMNLSAEALTPYGQVYGKVGQFFQGDGLAAQVGFRKPYLITGEGEDKDGYYFGGFIGHVESVGYSAAVVNSDNETKYKSKHENRVGAGAELSYLWQNSQRLNAASVAIAYAPSTNVNGQSVGAEPFILFSYTFQVNVF